MLFNRRPFQARFLFNRVQTAHMKLRLQAPNIEGMRIVGRAPLIPPLRARAWRLVNPDGSEFTAKPATSAAEALIALENKSQDTPEAVSQVDSRFLSLASGAQSQLWWVTRSPSTPAGRRLPRLARPRRLHFQVVGLVTVVLLGVLVAAASGRLGGLGTTTKVAPHPKPEPKPAPSAGASQAATNQSATTQRPRCAAWVAFGGVAVAIPVEAASAEPLQHRSLVQPNAKWVPACANTH